jgi:hypothetical protein
MAALWACSGAHLTWKRPRLLNAGSKDSLLRAGILCAESFAIYHSVSAGDYGSTK